MNIAIRVDASEQIGMGHLRRCLALGGMLREMGAEVTIVSRDLGLDWQQVARSEGIPCTRSLPPPGPSASMSHRPPGPAHALWAGVAQERDAAETSAALAGDRPEWIVVDSYSFDAHWHEAVREATGARICVVDDLGDRPLSAELVVDHNLSSDHSAKYGGKQSRIDRLLGGPAYALLGRRYRDAPEFIVRDPAASIGIFVGATDPWNASSAAALACFDHLGFRGQVEVATTTHNRHLPSLRALAQARPSLSLLVDSPDLGAFFARHDLQIGAGGGAALERCRVGAPSVLVALAENQRDPVRELAKRGAVREAPGIAPNLLSPVLAELLADPSTRRELSRTSRELLDGRGSERVALAMLAERAVLRPARPGDAKRAWHWRNAPETRRHFRDPSEIDLERHLAWWMECLGDPKRRLLVGSCGGIEIGIVRLDLDAGSAELAIYLDPTLHGLGLGTAMLRSAQEWVRQRELVLTRLVADVLPGNEASRRAFSAAGFVAADDRKRVWEVKRR